MMITDNNMANLDLYNRMRECPKDAQKEIKGGKLAGFTDINAMWRIKKLHEEFGADGWYTKIADKWVEHDGGESCAWVLVELYVKWPDTGEWSMPIVGFGGNKQTGKGKGDGINDESFKMAYTDALGSACKALGMAANIYWSEDRTKYSTAEETAPAARKPRQARNNTAEPVKAAETAGKPAKKMLTVAMFKAGELQPLIDWAVPHAGTKEGYEKALQTLRANYDYDDARIPEEIMKAAFRKIINK